MTGGRRCALLVATDRYEDEGFTELRAPAGDAKTLAAVLGDPEIGGFEVHEPLVNQPEGVVRREIDDFLHDARLNDTVLLYISGHGVLSQNGRLFFAMSDTRLERLRSTAVADSFVHDGMELSRAHRKVLILDCCHSGAFARGMATRSDGQVHIADRFQGRGHVTLTASDELEYALEEDEVKSLRGVQAGSLFTRLLVEGLRSGEADVNGDGQISADELYQFVFDRMRNLTTNQTPGIQGAVRGEIILATTQRRPAAAPQPAPAERARPRPQVANLLRRAEAKRARGELEPAREDLDEALRLAPESIEGLAARGDLRRRLGDLGGALADFEAALAIDADDYASLVGRGRVRAFADELEPSLADLARAIALDPQCPDAYVVRGFAQALAVPSRAAEAAADFEQVLASEPEHAEALAGVGALAMLDSREEDAIAALDRALAADPAEPLALALRGSLLGAEGLDELDRACELEPHSPYVRSVRGTAVGNLGRFGDAVTDFDAVLALIPRNARTLVQRAAARLQMGQPDEALPDLDMALQIDPGSAVALAWRAGTHLQRREPEAALADLDALAGREELAIGVPVAQLRAEALVALGRADEALGDLDRTPAGALDVAMLTTRGEARLELGRAGEAIADAQQALELHSIDPKARDLLVRAFLALAATVPPPGRAAGQKLVGEAELESGWYDDQKNQLLEALSDTERPLWLCRCRRQGEMFRSVAFLVTTEQVAWCKQGAFGTPQPGAVAIGDIRKVERIDGGFRLHAAGNVDAAFTGFAGGIDLVGPGVSLGYEGLLALLRLLVERGRAGA